MASQISHIIYAQKYLEKHPLPNGDKDLFILGSTFPDIRHIDENVKRKHTHMAFNPVDLNFEGLTPFQAGWKFHVYCDMKREEILNKYNFYDISETAKHENAPSKSLEDVLLYERNNNWEKTCLYLNNTQFFSQDLPVSVEVFQLWYAIVGKYIEKSPDERTIRIFLNKILKSTDKTKSIMESFEKLKNNEKAKSILLKVVEEIV